MNLFSGASSNLKLGIVLCIRPRHSETFAPSQGPAGFQPETRDPTLNNRLFWGKPVQKNPKGHFITKLFTFSASPQYPRETTGGTL